MKIKVCGITDIEQMKSLQELEIDYAGMIFYKDSKRDATEKLNGLAVATLTIKKVGVFVNAEMKTIEKAIKDYDLYAVQLHGDETDEFCLELMDKVKVIKVFKIDESKNIDEQVKPFLNVCHYFLFDTAPKNKEGEKNIYGGTGKKFNWNILKEAKINKPFFLSGGISLSDVEEIKKIDHPCHFAVDINSCFEKELGVKDLALVNEFKKKITGYE